MTIRINEFRHKFDLDQTLGLYFNQLVSKELFLSRNFHFFKREKVTAQKVGGFPRRKRGRILIVALVALYNYSVRVKRKSTYNYKVIIEFLNTFYIKI